MRSLPSLVVPILLSLVRGAFAQAEATFPLQATPDESDTSDEDDAPDEQAPEEQAPGPSPARQPPAQPAASREDNPYGPPPTPPPPMPGNPYGTVPHRPPTPETNPYMGAAPAAPSQHSKIPEEMEKTNWSVGGGLAVETPSGVGNTDYTAYYPDSPRFSSSLLFERRLSRSLFLLVQPRIHYQKAENEPLNPDGETNSFEELRLGIEAGIRWVANPGSTVELGMSHLARVEYNQFVQDGSYGFVAPGYAGADADQIVVGLSNAFIAERRLIPHLWLRLGAGLFGIHHYSTKITAIEEDEDEETGETSETERDSRIKGFRVGLIPSLALQLRLTF